MGTKRFKVLNESFSANIKMNKSFFVSFGSFNERNEGIDSEKDLFEQESIVSSILAT